MKSELDNVTGIGVKRRTELLKHFGSVAKIKSASVDELADVPSMNKTVAEALKKFFTVQIAELQLGVRS